MSTPRRRISISGTVEELHRMRVAINEALQAYDEFQKKLAKLPPEIAKGLGSSPEAHRRGRKPRVETGEMPEDDEDRPPKTHFERVVDYYRSINNAPQTARQLREATGLQRGNISLMLYKSHKEEFERVETEGDSTVRWRLANDLGSNKVVWWARSPAGMGGDSPISGSPHHIKFHPSLQLN